MRKMICLCITGILMLSGCGKNAQAGTGAAEGTVLKENQEIVYGQIETIAGNDMTIALAEAEETEVQGKAPSQGTEKTTSTDKEGQEPDMGSMPDMGEMPSGGDGSFPEGIPSQGGMPGQAHEDGEQSDSQGKKDTQEREDTRENEEQDTQKVTTYALTGETKNMRIPVGTTVTTSLGTTTTFSRLAAGDMVKLVVQKENDKDEIIVGIWIVG